MAVNSGSPFGLRLRATLSQITEEAARLLGVEGAGLRLIEGDEMVRVAAFGPDGAIMPRERIRIGESLTGRVATSGRPVIVNDADADPIYDPLYRATAERHGFHSWLGVPLRDQDRVIGVLMMQSRTAHRFGPMDVRLLEAFAGQATVAIENAQLYERERERRRQLEAVREVTAWLASETDLDTLMERVSRLVTELLGVHSVAVYLWDEASERLIPRAWHGFGDWLGSLRLRLGEGLAGTVAQNRVGIIVDDYRAQPFAQAAVVEHSTASAAIGEPLLYHGELRGAITASAEHGERTFSDQDRQLLSLFAGQVVIAIEHARLHEARDLALAEVEARRRRASFLSEASATLAATLDYESTLQQVARLAVPTIAEVCTVFVVAEDGEIRRAATAHGETVAADLVDALWRSWSGSVSPRSMVATAIRTRRPVFNPVISPDHRESIVQDPVHRETLRKLNFRSSIVVPLQARGETIGALAMFISDPERQYGPTDLALAESLAGRAALAVDNARLYREARRAIQVRDEFLSVAAHELKTPVTTLLGFSQLLLSQLGREDGLDQHLIERTLRAVEQGSKRMARLVAQILDVSRLDGGRLVLDREHADLAELVRGIAEAMQTTTSRHTLHIETPDTLPALIDPLRLEQVVTNLLDNAIKFSPKGGRIRVQLAEPTPGLARLTVIDSGIGIPPERRQHIFERFYQAHERDHVAGLGLGLYISRQIVELHDGSIEPEFPPEGGCRFIIELPTQPVGGALTKQKEAAP